MFDYQRVIVAQVSGDLDNQIVDVIFGYIQIVDTTQSLSGIFRMIHNIMSLPVGNVGDMGITGLVATAWYPVV